MSPNSLPVTTGTIERVKNARPEDFLTEELASYLARSRRRVTTGTIERVKNALALAVRSEPFRRLINGFEPAALAYMESALDAIEAETTPAEGPDLDMVQAVRSLGERIHGGKPVDVALEWQTAGEDPAEWDAVGVWSADTAETLRTLGVGPEDIQDLIDDEEARAELLHRFDDYPELLGYAIANGDVGVTDAVDYVVKKQLGTPTPAEAWDTWIGSDSPSDYTVQGVKDVVANIQTSASDRLSEAAKWRLTDLLLAYHAEAAVEEAEEEDEAEAELRERELAEEARAERAISAAEDRRSWGGS